MGNFKLIDKRGKGNTLLQVIGFALILFGIIYLIIFLTFKIEALTSSKLAIVFFVIMMGVALAFPELLQDQNHGLSTMRLVVFMMINVICILMLQIGWGKGSFDLIGINSYWMGIIAFVFGAKATQSYFESKMAVPPVADPSLVQPPAPTVPATADMVRAAIQQNQNLLTQYPNIVTMVLGSMLSNGQYVFCAAIHVSNNVTSGIPTQLTVNYNGERAAVPATIISDLGPAKTNAAPGDKVANKISVGQPGTLGCFLTDATNNFYALSCCHVMSNNQWQNYTGYLTTPGPVLSDKTSVQDIGNWAFALMNGSFDFAYANVALPAIVQSASLKTPRDVIDNDILHKTPVAFTGAATQNGTGNICYYQCSRAIVYANGSYQLNNLILISNNLQTSPSLPGDSGALVYTAGLNEPIGIIVAGDTQFTYVLPIMPILGITAKTIY